MAWKLFPTSKDKYITEFKKRTSYAVNVKTMFKILDSYNFILKENYM